MGREYHSFRETTDYYSYSIEYESLTDPYMKGTERKLIHFELEGEFSHFLYESNTLSEVVKFLTGYDDVIKSQIEKKDYKVKSKIFLDVEQIDLEGDFIEFFHDVGIFRQIERYLFNVIDNEKFNY